MTRKDRTTHWRMQRGNMPRIVPTSLSAKIFFIEGTGNHLSSAAILGLDGTVWAQSANFPQFKPEEMKAIINEFNEAGTLAPTGLFLGGAKYMVIQGETGSVIRGKKGAGGICIKKTGQAMVMGIYDEPVAPGQCNMIVERMGDYLVDQGM